VRCKKSVNVVKANLVGNRLESRCPECGNAISQFVRVNPARSKCLRVDNHAWQILAEAGERQGKSLTTLLSASTLWVEQEGDWGEALELAFPAAGAHTVRIRPEGLAVLQRVAQHSGLSISAVASAVVRYAQLLGAWDAVVDLALERGLTGEGPDPGCEKREKRSDLQAEIAALGIRAGEGSSLLSAVLEAFVRGLQQGRQ